MDLNFAIQQMVEQAVQQYVTEANELPDLITPKQAAEICGVDVSVIHSLINDSTANFPAAKLSPRITKIDKKRLGVWLRNGGLHKKDQ